MLYCISKACYSAKYVSSGILNSEDQFVHPRRLLDTFVLIVVQEGTLHVASGANFYDVKPGEYLVLLEGQEHYGYKPSSGHLSYYWTHFYITDPDCKYYSTTAAQRKISSIENKDIYLLAEHGSLSLFKRTEILFSQLLDIAKRERYMESWKCNYAISLLLLELTSEIMDASTFSQKKYPPLVENIMSYIQANFDQPLTVADLAKMFNYHPTYLTAIFKQYTGTSLINYINQTRISVAKGLLVSTPLRVRYTLSEIAQMCGFSNEKYFIRVFEKYEGITPTEYRNSFGGKKVNKK